MKVMTISVSPIGTNCYLLCDDKTDHCGIIDPGGEPARIIAAVEEAGLTPECILLTHGHYDHTGGVAGLTEHWPELPIYISEKDVFPAEDRKAARLFPALKGDVHFYGEGSDVKVGQINVHVLATPGHTAGSVTLVAEDVMFSGDTLFAGSCGRTDLYGGSWEEMMASLRRLGNIQRNFQVLPGHMDPSDLECERQTNPYLRQAMRG